MKYILLALLSFAIGGFAAAQTTHRNAPERVRQAFSHNFPDAADARWSHSGTQWSATFDDRSSEDRGEMVAHFDENGRYIDSHIPYAENDVPQRVYESAKKRYHKSHVHVTMIDRPSHPDVFEVSGQVDGKRQTTYYDEEGRVHSYNDRH
jgi:hypothetical protein